MTLENGCVFHSIVSVVEPKDDYSDPFEESIRVIRKSIVDMDSETFNGTGSRKIKTKVETVISECSIIFTGESEAENEHSPLKAQLNDEESTSNKDNVSNKIKTKVETAISECSMIFAEESETVNEHSSLKVELIDGNSSTNKVNVSKELSYLTERCATNMTLQDYKSEFPRWNKKMATIPEYSEPAIDRLFQGGMTECGRSGEVICSRAELTQDSMSGNKSTPQVRRRDRASVLITRFLYTTHDGVVREHVRRDQIQKDMSSQKHLGSDQPENKYVLKIRVGEEISMVDNFCCAFGQQSFECKGHFENVTTKHVTTEDHEYKSKRMGKIFRHEELLLPEIVPNLFVNEDSNKNKDIHHVSQATEIPSSSIGSEIAPVNSENNEFMDPIPEKHEENVPNRYQRTRSKQCIIN